MKRIIIIALITTVACLSFVFLLQSGYLFAPINLIYKTSREIGCMVKGGTAIYQKPYDEYYCEIKAKDAGKVCFHDDDCSKKNCLYPVPSACTNKTYCIFPEDKVSIGGRCDDYVADNNCTLVCHNGINLQLKTGVVCEYACWTP